MAERIQNRLEEYFDRLWPINRSIVSPGFRQSLDILSDLVPFKTFEFPTGKKVYDWEVPQEWDVEEAYFIAPDGKKYCDFSINNLYVISHSAPFEGKVSLDELKKHLFSLPEQPDAVPYITSFYKERWGFCIPYNQMKSLPDGEYEVVIRSKLYSGKLVVGEAVLPGKSDKEVLFSSYLCHPSLANNELSGPLALAFLYEKVKAIPERKFTYRFAVMPETIGAICYLSQRGKQLKENVVAGLVMTCLAYGDDFNYKETKNVDTLTNRTIQKIFRDKNNLKTVPYTPIAGSDERQYGSPGFHLPVGSLMRSYYIQYPEYHTSLDNKDLISFDTLNESIEKYFEFVQYLENTTYWKNTVMYGEPQLGKRGLYPSITEAAYFEDKVNAMLWILNLADGTHDLEDMKQRTNYSQDLLEDAAKSLHGAGLLTT